MTQSLFRRSKVPLSKRLTIRLLRNVILSVLIVEFILASSQIWFDYVLQDKDLRATAEQVLRTSEQAATHAIWTLDKEGAQDLVAGLLRHDAIVKVELVGSADRMFALAEKEKTVSSPLERWVFGGYRVYVKELSESFRVGDVETVGKLKLTFDTGAAGAVFFKRTIFFVVIGLLMNLLLASILFYVFHITMTRSILLIGDAMARVNPDRPGGHRILLPGRHKDDELGRLVRKTNVLLKAVGENIQRRQEAEGEVVMLNQELEKRVETRTRELELANRELKSFSYTVSHDLRGPVRGITGLAEVLLEDYGDRLDEDGVKCLQLLRASSLNMDALISGLLKLSQSTRGGIAPEHVALSTLVAEIFERLGESEPERKISVIVDAGIDAIADPKLIKIVLDNLANNAWKYTRKNNQAEISFGMEQLGEEKVYFMKDNGVGFDMSLADRLFAPFQRLHVDTDFSGTGIGLATVSRIVFRHGGRVWAESVSGEGTVFRFVLGTDNSH